MPIDIITKYETGGAGDEPTGADLQKGELAVNTAAGKLWVGTGGGVQPIGGGGGQVLPGGADGQTLRWELDDEEWQATSDLVVSDGGNVGIGTDSPAASLDIGGAKANGTVIQSLGEPLQQPFKLTTTVVGEGQTANELMYVQGMVFNSALNGWIGHQRGGVTGDGSLLFGTGGTTAAPTERMRITDTGNVGIGVIDDPVGAAQLFVGNNSTDGDAQARFFAPDTEDDFYIGVQNSDFGIMSAGDGKIFKGGGGAGGKDIAITASGGAVKFAAGSNSTERMRITSDGAVGIGTDSPFNRLHIVGPSGVAGGHSAQGTDLTIEASASTGVNIHSDNASIGNIFFSDPEQVGAGRVIYAHTDDSLRFATNGNNERMRIDSSGNVGIGASTPAVRLHVQSSGVAARIYRSTASAGNSVQQWYSDVNGANSLAANVDGQGRFNGELSDASLKKNIADSTLGLAELMQVNVRSFDWIGSGEHEPAGFIAQELETVLPNAVHTLESGIKGRRDANLVPVLVKAIQELTARVEALEA